MANVAPARSGRAMSPLKMQKEKKTLSLRDLGYLSILFLNKCGRPWKETYPPLFSPHIKDFSGEGETRVFTKNYL